MSPRRWLGWGAPAADQLAERGYVLLEDWLGAATAEAIRTEVLHLRREGHFRPAKVGHGPRRLARPEVRRDEIAWLRTERPAGDVVQEAGNRDVNGDGVLGHDGVLDGGPAIASFLGKLADLRCSLNRDCFLGLVRTECHASCYGPGAYYREHVDAFRDSDLRTISFVYFLNPQWSVEHGGALVLRALQPVIVAPRLDRLVLFRSADLPHEVQTSHRDRYALTGWFSVRDLSQPLATTLPLG